MHRFSWTFVTAVVLLTGMACAPPADAPSSTGPRHILLTNDNGIDDVPLIELARALAALPGFDVTVVAATVDRSGTSNFLGATSSGRYRATRRDLGPGIDAWALDGYPADCVVFAVSGPLRDRLPDLVVSGINGGANLGDDWFGSGTIGAARTAAYLGIPAAAVSGVEDDDPAAVAAAVDWVVRFVQSGLVASLEAPDYVTVSLPEDGGRPGRPKIVERARGLLGGGSNLVERNDSSEVWALAFETLLDLAAEGTDVAAAARGDVAVVTMRANEYAPDLAARFRRGAAALPEWVPASSPPPPFACEAGLGVIIDDAEDPDGREWGVVLEEVMAGGLAEELGFEVGDVITSFNDTVLESQPGDPEDPDDVFVRLLRALPCDTDVTLEYVRDGARHLMQFVWTTRRDP